MGQLCDICKTIPWAFFDKGPRNSKSKELAVIEHHPSFAGLQASSESGCALCQLILYVANEEAKIPRERPLSDEERENYKRPTLHLNSFLELNPAELQSFSDGPDAELRTLPEYLPLVELTADKKIVLRQDTLAIHPSDSGGSVFYFLVEIGTRVDGESQLEFHIPFVYVPASAKNLVTNHRKADLCLMSSWISDCIDNHLNCRCSASEQILPTRIIDVCAIQGSQNVRLVESAGLKAKIDKTEITYVALSYCWGQNMPRSATTLVENLEKNLEEIEYSDLPKTIQDAIRVTRELGFRYIWIDALCIIQDVQDDWERESASMGQVYSNATFTIAVGTAEGCTEGFRLDEARKGKSKGFYIKQEGSTPDQHHIIYLSPYGRSGHGSTNLDKRAWTLQERELSRRSLYFTDRGVFWECRSASRSNNLPWGTYQKRMAWDKNILDAGFQPDDTGKWWCQRVEDYTTRSMTNTSDKLPALSGLAHEIHGILGGQYAAGIWTSHLLESLLWRTRSGPHRRPPAYRSPSWSWASLDGPIFWHSGITSKAGVRLPTTLEVQTSPASLDPYGAVASGHLRVSGRLKTAFCVGGLEEQHVCHPKDGNRRYYHYEPGRKILDTGDGSDGARCVGLVIFDIDEEGREPRDVFCLRLCAQHVWEDRIPLCIWEGAATASVALRDLTKGIGLVLEPTGGKEGEYRRIGFLGHALDAWFGDIDEAVVTVV